MGFKWMVFIIGVTMSNGLRILQSNRQKISSSMLRASFVMSDITHFEYLVVGGGSGGISSAKRAAFHGARVGVIEYKPLGGTCNTVF